MNKTKYPKVKFVRDRKIDLKYAINFTNSRDDFKKMFFGDVFYAVFNGSFSKKERDKIITNYVTTYYKLNAKKISQRYGLAQLGWKNKEKQYFTLIDKLFKNHPWPNGKYVGYGTIFWCYPRFVQNKEFLFPLNHRISDYSDKVTAHELLHFMFFDYLEKNYGLTENSWIKGKEPNYIWKVSEALNSVIEGWKPYQKIFNSIARPYPETKKIYEKIRKMWNKTQDIDIVLKSLGLKKMVS